VIASLRGTLAEKGAGTCVIEAGGVGYQVLVSTHTLASLPERGANVFLRTRQIVREDSLQLFGFSDADELKLFDLLIGVSGVGPKLALALLSGMAPAAVVRAIRGEAVATLTTIPGIGRKTAERVIVELRDKLEAPVAPAREGGVLPRSARMQDAVAALTRLGYTPGQAQEVLRGLGDDADSLSLEDLVRRALAHLGKAAVTSR
jgi:holliday junction DNA helicase RuvA